MTGEKNEAQQQESEESATGQEEEIAAEAVEELTEEEDLEKDLSPDEEINLLKEQLGNCQDTMLRMAAEQENFKKRMERERATMLKYAGENILRELLNTVDNLDRALEQADNDSADPELAFKHMMEGVELTRKGLLASLEKFEVLPMECIGVPFDPNRQDALTMENSDDVPNSHVLREFSRGYMFKDRLLRAAKVVVSNGPAED